MDSDEESGAKVPQNAKPQKMRDIVGDSNDRRDKCSHLCGVIALTLFERHRRWCPEVTGTVWIVEPHLTIDHSHRFLTKLGGDIREEELALGSIDEAYCHRRLGSAHFSANDRYKKLRERAYEYAWLLDQLGRAED